MTRDSRAKRIRASLVALIVVCLLGAGGLLRAQQAAAGRQAQSESADVRRLEAALRSPDATERARAANGLAQKGAAARAAMPALIELLADATVVNPAAYRQREPWNMETDFTVGKEAARALVRIGGPSVEPLIDVLAQGQTEARRNAAWALGAIRDARAVEPLSKALADADERVRAQAAWALGALRDARAVESLSAALNDASTEVREQAAWALGALRDARATDALCAALKGRDAEARTQAAWALGAIRDARAVSALVAALNDESASVREQAAWALGAIGDARAADALRAALNDRSEQVRQQAAWALSVVTRTIAVKKY